MYKKGIDKKSMSFFAIINICNEILCFYICIPNKQTIGLFN